MRILMANLKHLYQNRALWAFYVFVAAVVAAMAWFRSGDDKMLGRAGILYGTMLAVVIPLSHILGGMQAHVMDRGFAFCLPNHRFVARRVVFLVGMAASLIITVAIPHGDVRADCLVAVLVATFSLVLAVFLAGAGLMIVSGGVSIILGGLGLLVLFFDAKHLCPKVDYLVLVVPHITILLGVLTVAVTWLALGHPYDRRRDRFVYEIGNSSIFAFYRRAELEESGSVDRASSWIQGRLFHAISASGPTSIVGHVMSSLYAESVRMNTAWKWIGILLLGMVAWAGFGPSLRFFLFFMFAEAPGDVVCRVIFSSSLRVGGRRERACTVLILLVAGCGLLVAGLWVAVCATNLLMPLLSGVKVGSITLTYHPIPMQWLWIVLAVCPLAAVLRVWTYGRPLWQAGLTLAIIMGVLWLFWDDDVPLKGIPPLGMLAVAVASWLVCVLGTFRVATRTDLVRG